MGESGTGWESRSETCTSPYVKQIASGSLLFDAGSSNPVLCDNLEDELGGGREVQEGGDICVPMTDSHYCMPETNTTSKSSYPPTEKKKKKVYLDLSLEHHYLLVLTPFLLISGQESAEFLSWRLWNLRGKR